MTQGADEVILSVLPRNKIHWVIICLHSPNGKSKMNLEMLREMALISGCAMVYLFIHLLSYYSENIC